MLVGSDCYKDIPDTRGMLKKRCILLFRRFEAANSRDNIEVTEFTLTFERGPLDHSSHSRNCQVQMLCVQTGCSCLKRSDTVGSRYMKAIRNSYTWSESRGVKTKRQDRREGNASIATALGLRNAIRRMFTH
jgi:hypothetical protein